MSDIRVLSRKTDPESSRLAADEVAVSGAADNQREACLKVVLKKPGLTSAEIAKNLGFDRHQAARRLPELRDQVSLIINGEPRKCAVTNRKSITWFPV